MQKYTDILLILGFGTENKILSGWGAVLQRCLNDGSYAFEVVKDSFSGGSASFPPFLFSSSSSTGDTLSKVGGISRRLQNIIVIEG